MTPPQETSSASGSRITIPGCLIVATETYAILGQACLEAGTLETGGLVIGRRVNLEGRLFLIAVQLTGPGQQAIRQPNSFAPDTAFAQQELERVRQEYAGRAITVDYIGEWHKHPTNYPAPSEGDVKQARTILQDPSYSLEWGEIVLPIATVGREGQLELKPYYFSRLHPKPVLIDLLVWEREGIEALLEETTSSSR